jgi:hypothetical protein
VCLLGEPAGVADGRQRLNDPVTHPMLPNHGTISFRFSTGDDFCQQLMTLNHTPGLATSQPPMT